MAHEMEGYVDLGPVKFDLADTVRSEVVFKLFTNSNDPGTTLHEENVQNITLNTSLPTKFLIHGWRSNLQTNFYQKLREAYFKKGDYNVVYVDWTVPASKPYEISTANIKPVGNFVGDLIVAAKFELEKVHLIGNSMGAHVASFAGKRVFGVTGEKIGRITGTDPAGPKFKHEGPATRLHKSDAEFVDVVHTNTSFYGLPDPVGTVDFYPNGGEYQLGCPGGFEAHECSHRRAIIYFTESVNSDSFKAKKCASWDALQKGKFEGDELITFGENVDRAKSGIYHFATNHTAPFALG